MIRWTVPLAFLLAAACATVPPPEAPVTAEADPRIRVVEDIEQRREQFRPVVIEADLDHLSAGDREAIDHLIEAGRAMSRIFARQAWADNPDFAREVVARLEGDGAEAAREYYRIMVGPWDRLDGLEPFLGDAPHPPGAGYYPVDLTAEELEAWIATHPGDAEAFRSLHTVIRRDGDRLVAVPYSEAYEADLAAAEASLRAAADATTDPSLERFLRLRADAFSTDDYYASDLAWMDLDGDIEVVVGPYETYEDKLFGYKAAFEMFLTVVQPEDSEALARFKGELPALERALPIPDEHKNLDRGSESPIRVADELFTAGDTRAGVQTLAFNLPNDERVREEKGSKKVLLKNMMEAKYRTILEPIAAHVLPQAEADRVDWDAYFHFILFHELAHGLGPGRITVDGRETEVRLELKELYSPLEEAKADVLGVWNLYVLNDRGVVPDEIVEPLPWTYTAGLFRSARFGVTAAHGLGVVTQLEYLLDRGALELTDEGRIRPVPDRFRPAIRELAHDLLMLQAVGDQPGSTAFVERYGTVRPRVAELLASLEEIPVDVDPIYPIAGESR